MSDNIFEFGAKTATPEETGPGPSIYTISYEDIEGALSTAVATGYMIHYGEYLTVTASPDLSSLVVPLIAIRHARVISVVSQVAPTAAVN